METEIPAASATAPPTELLAMIVSPAPGTPLPVPKPCAAATAFTGVATPATGAPPTLKPHRLSFTLAFAYVLA